MRALTANSIPSLLLSILLWLLPSLAHSSGINARYVHIELPGSERTLSLAEVEVYNGRENLALQGTATQISTLRDSLASLAIDGNRSGRYATGSVTHTQTEEQPWWRLDLGRVRPVTKLVVHNRSDCCGERLAPARILLEDETGTIVWEGAIGTAASKYEFDVTRPPSSVARVSPNLLRNASFRQCTNPEIPDFWDLHHVAALTIKDLHDSYGVVIGKEPPVSGARVLKIVNPEERFNHLALMSRRQSARLAEGYYTFSVYLKTDRAGSVFKVTPAFGRGKPTVHRVTSSWKRYSATFYYSGSKSDLLQPILYFPEKGTYHIAAPQLERGNAATSFQPATDDADPPELKRVGQRNARVLSDLVNDFAVPRSAPPLSALFEYNYYTDDTVARLRIIAAPGRDATVRVRCTDTTAGTILFEEAGKLRVPAGTTIDLDIPVAGMPTGEHPCVVSPVSNREHGTITVNLRRLPPNPTEVRINQFRRTLVINKKPFHIIGMAIGSWKLPPDWYLSDLVLHGINTVFCTFPLNAGGTFDASVSTFLAAADRHGLKVVVGIPLAGVKPRDWRQRLDAYTRLIGRAAGSPAVIGWWPVDEPADGSWKDEDFQAINREIRDKDPYRPVMMNWNSDSVPLSVGNEPKGTLKFTDFYSIDYYPLAGTRKTTTIDGFTETTVRMALISRIRSKVPHSWIQLYGGDDAWREPTADELKYMVYLNLLLGGMTSYWDTKSNSRATWEQLATLNKQVETLARKLFLNPEAREVSRPHVANGFVSAVWKVGNAYYVIAVNADSVTAHYEFDIGRFEQKHVSNANVLFEKRTITLAGRYLRDSFGPFESRVYVMEYREQ